MNEETLREGALTQNASYSEVCPSDSEVWFEVLIRAVFGACHLCHSDCLGLFGVGWRITCRDKDNHLSQKIGTRCEYVFHRWSFTAENQGLYPCPTVAGRQLRPKHQTQIQDSRTNHGWLVPCSCTKATAALLVSSLAPWLILKGQGSQFLWSCFWVKQHKTKNVLHTLLSSKKMAA